MSVGSFCVRPSPACAPWFSAGICGWGRGMQDQLELVFPIWPPSVNKEWRNVGGRAILSEPARVFRRRMKDHVLLMRLERLMPEERITGALSLRITLYPPDSRRRDVDNYAKNIFDSFTQAKVWHDDAQVKRLTVEFGEPIRGGGFRVLMEPYRR